MGRPGLRTVAVLFGLVYNIAVSFVSAPHFVARVGLYEIISASLTSAAKNGTVISNRESNHAAQRLNRSICP